MFPASAFDEDEREEGLPPIGGPQMLLADPNDPPLEGEANESFGSNLSNNLGRLNPLSRIRAEYNDIYSSGNGHGVMNLKELDAYVQETVRAQRQQRRKELLIKVAILISFVVIASAMFSSSIFVYEDVKGSHPFHKKIYKTEKKASKFTLPRGYVRSECEVKMTHNRSFMELIDDTEYLDDEPACRTEATDCKWLNPTIPAPRNDENTVVSTEWKGAFQFNIHHIQGMIKTRGELDVVLVGDSIVEHWEGKDMGISEVSLRRDHEVFEELFTRHGGGKIDGMAHGIGGDRCANLLYRLENGEMPEGFNPKVWWVLVGTEDWFQGIDSHTIVAGIVKIVESIREVHPHSHIVINSILPRGNEERDGNPHYESLHEINRMLDCFVASENARRFDNVHVPELSFFNATDIFLFRDPEVGYFVNPALLPDYIHPSAQGEEIWGRQIVKKVLRLTSKDHKHQ